MINDIEVIDMPDGSTKVSMDLEPEMQKMLIKQGLEYIIKEMKIHEKINSGIQILRILWFFFPIFEKRK